ncbi:MAG: hypothetical protein ABFE01_11415 [Phycisphaerales bacterium]
MPVAILQLSGNQAIQITIPSEETVHEILNQVSSAAFFPVGDKLWINTQHVIGVQLLTDEDVAKLKEQAANQKAPRLVVPRNGGVG